MTRPVFIEIGRGMGLHPSTEFDELIVVIFTDLYNSTMRQGFQSQNREPSAFPVMALSHGPDPGQARVVQGAHVACHE